MSCRACGARCDYCEPYKSREHDHCLCGCGASLRGLKADAKYATHACKLRVYRRDAAQSHEVEAR